VPLLVVPTPIGNLEDITLRALRALREADAIACEDTRRTGKLLAHYEIENGGRLVAYHEHNEARKAPALSERAREETVALVSDAGTPLVSDPGYRLVRACIEAGVEVRALPGASAMLTALVASGMTPEGAVFVGFPPRSGGERTRLFERIGSEEATFVLFESPHRLVATLGELPGETPVAACRELTKLHEEVFRGTAEDALLRFSGATGGPQEVRGEIALVVRGGAATRDTGPDEALALARRYVQEGESPSKAAARAARDAGLKKSEVYDLLVQG
jgi:16S rRNA (cytidine1402-2'-O)-methyltransferase